MSPAASWALILGVVAVLIGVGGIWLAVSSLRQGRRDDMRMSDAWLARQRREGSR